VIKPEENHTNDAGTNYEYDYEIAVTRNDIETKGMSASVEYRMPYRDRDEEHGRVGTDRAEVNK